MCSLRGLLGLWNCSFIWKRNAKEGTQEGRAELGLWGNAQCLWLPPLGQDQPGGRPAPASQLLTDCFLPPKLQRLLIPSPTPSPPPQGLLRERVCVPAGQAKAAVNRTEQTGLKQPTFTPHGLLVGTLGSWWVLGGGRPLPGSSSEPPWGILGRAGATGLPSVPDLIKTLIP